MKPYPFSNLRIAEIVRTGKCLEEGEVLEFTKHGASGLGLDVNAALKDGQYLAMRFVVHCSDAARPHSYESGFLLAGPRVRGIGYSPIERKKKYKVHIPKGWHENILDPNLVGDDANRHEALPDFSPTDLKDFTKKSAARWNIDLEFHEGLL
jgi:hypothetical protein